MVRQSVSPVVSRSGSKFLPLSAALGAPVVSRARSDQVGLAASISRGGNQPVISQRLQFVEIGHAGAVRDAGSGPYLDYRPIRSEERDAVADRLTDD